jgi:UDP-N-acetylmuramoyl-tripeptide--D-alanyl-D-alanine ligase
LKALQCLASWARDRWGNPIVAVTGSAGKTTTKDVIAAMLATTRKTGKTTGNFNNHFGLPVSLLRIPQDAECAVLELGMNHAGEIRALAEIAKPQIGVVTNVGYAHVENFESIEGVAAAKRELIEALPAGGVAVLNADDEHVRTFGDTDTGRVVTFGIAEDADVRAEHVELRDDGVAFRVGKDRFESPLSGIHGVRNILAGISVAREFGVEVSKLQQAARELVPGKMRGERFTHNGIKILNDCYNSNPEAARAMLDVLKAIPAQRHIAVLGEMLELGRYAEPLHRDVGRYVVACGIPVLVGIRGAAHFMVDAAMGAGHAGDAAYFFQDPEEAGEKLREIARPGDAILFKGSRGTHVEKAIERFLK